MKMNNQYMYYPSYYSNRNYGYYVPSQPFTAFSQHYTQNLPNTNINDQQNLSNNYINKDYNTEYRDNKENEKKEPFKFGPLNISSEKISIFGFSIQIDDLILIALILFLFFETDCDYSIIIVLGLILFNISFSTLNIFNT